MCSHLSVQIPSPLAPSILFLQAQRGAERSPEGGSVSSGWFSRSGAEGRHEPLSAAFSLSKAKGERSSTPRAAQPRLFTFILNRNRAALRWRAEILLQASSAARCSGRVAVL